MGTSRNGGQLLAKIDNYVGAIPRANRDAVEESALLLVTFARQGISQATGGDGRLSGFGTKNGKIGARYDIKGATNPTAFVRMTGPAQLIENGVKAHFIAPKATGSRRRRGAGDADFGGGAFGKGYALRTPYGPKAQVFHPGYGPGKKTWQKARERYEGLAGETFARAHRAALGKAFR